VDLPITGKTGSLSDKQMRTMMIPMLFLIYVHLKDNHQIHEDATSLQIRSSIA
jgi:uncharacterized membrane protein AbrB (regulator of aidB expression)